MFGFSIMRLSGIFRKGDILIPKSWILRRLVTRLQYVQEVLVTKPIERFNVLIPQPPAELF